jgi:hypothetical protein
MRRVRILLGVYLVTIACLVASSAPSAAGHFLQAVRDPKTRVTYYLESDRRHVLAVNSAGKVLWTCDVDSDPNMGRLRADTISIGDDVNLSVHVFAGVSGGNAVINKRTGVFWGPFTMG